MFFRLMRGASWSVAMDPAAKTTVRERFYCSARSASSGAYCLLSSSGRLVKARVVRRAGSRSCARVRSFSLSGRFFASALARRASPATISTMLRRALALGGHARRAVAQTRGFAAEVEVEPPLKLYGLPGRYASALFVAASKANALPTVETELGLVRVLRSFIY